MIHEFLSVIPVVTPLGNGYAIYVKSNGMWENDEVCVAMEAGGQWRHFNTGQIKSFHNETYGISKATPEAKPEPPARDLAQQVQDFLDDSPEIALQRQVGAMENLRQDSLHRP